MQYIAMSAHFDPLTAARIEELAKSNGRTMEDVCRIAKVHRATWYRFKNGGNLTIDRYRKLRDAAAGRGDHQ